MASQTKMMKQISIRYSQTYKDEALVLADHIRVNRAAEQLGPHASQLCG